MLPSDDIDGAPMVACCSLSGVASRLCGGSVCGGEHIHVKYALSYDRWSYAASFYGDRMSGCAAGSFIPGDGTASRSGFSALDRKLLGLSAGTREAWYGISPFTGEDERQSAALVGETGCLIRLRMGKSSGENSSGAYAGWNGDRESAGAV